MDRMKWLRYVQVRFRKKKMRYTLNTSKPSPTEPGIREPPEGYMPTEWVHDFECVRDMPCDIFRDTSCESCLGPQANKCGEYKNPEYFSYHKFSHTAMHAFLNDKRAFRCARDTAEFANKTKKPTTKKK